ncbi:hypothetical protein PCC9214_03992 [Planktothrix tepida]|uniref:Uncharacterized protein n=1 Tax=Planktothrix pseudagardhii TaxID=132604 RepID=A0A9W4G4T6_9CYAN|nr:MULTISPECIES: hypothetical protein [Planktothrix]CAD5936700.1 hypothetical protein NO713_01645 [Planktothrix pseudagardhii]CAD5973629.1 hypothetical protein PCC9214_03992 [Planktothrix tepida]
MACLYLGKKQKIGYVLNAILKLPKSDDCVEEVLNYINNPK